jgi:hypothetical protein
MSGYVPSFDIVVQSLSTAVSMAKGFLALKQEADRQQLVIDLQGKILEAQDEAVKALDYERNLNKQLDALEAELKELKSQKALVATMTRKDGFAFLPNDPDPCCARCAEVDIRVVHVSRTTKLELRRRIWACRPSAPTRTCMRARRCCSR